jgi:tetratricopeptide (TPR) repeat protein
MRGILLSMLLFAMPPSAFAQAEGGEAGQNPFATAAEALERRESMSRSELAAYIDKRIAMAEPQSANALFFTAELLQQAGDYRAEEYYEKAIAADASEPAYELFYADYLRNFRGPLRPLFAEALLHYSAAIEKLRGQPASRSWAPAVRDRVERGLVALYQEDGIPLAWKRAAADLLAPVLFLSPALRTARSTSDLDEVHDARDFTAEAQFAASASRLGRALTLDELRGLIRRKQPEETLDHLRLRLADSSLDVVYARRLVQNAQVTNFFVPDRFNRVEVSAIGIAATQVVAMPPIFDAALNVGWQDQQRRGLIEFLPQAMERVRQTQGELTLSRFFGPDRADLGLAYLAQEIAQQIPDPPRRDRRIASARLTYEVLRPLWWLKNPYGNRFVTRGWEFYGGFVDDREHFGAVEVKKRDFLLGTSLRGIGRFDVTLQPTLFTVDVGEDRSQSSSQLRAEVNLLYRILDEEAKPGIPEWTFLGLRPAFVHLVASFRHDSARDGLTAFENDRLGLGVEAKLFVRGFADTASPGDLRFRGTTFLAGLHLAHERFPRLKKDAEILELSVSAGY